MRNLMGTDLHLHRKLQLPFAQNRAIGRTTTLSVGL